MRQISFPLEKFGKLESSTQFEETIAYRAYPVVQIFTKSIGYLDYKDLIPTLPVWIKSLSLKVKTEKSTKISPVRREKV